jgi:transposase
LRLEGGAERLLEKLLECCRERDLVKARGKQRTDATRVEAAIRVLNRLELVGETVRATLNDLATVAPDWLRSVAPQAWYERYDRRIEDDRLPQSEAKRQAYAQTVGEDGFLLLDRLAQNKNSPKARVFYQVIQSAGGQPNHMITRAIVHVNLFAYHGIGIAKNDIRHVTLDLP